MKIKQDTTNSTYKYELVQSKIFTAILNKVKETADVRIVEKEGGETLYKIQNYIIGFCVVDKSSYLSSCYINRILTALYDKTLKEVK
jgi:hypothetical protein